MPEMAAQLSLIRLLSEDTMSGEEPMTANGVLFPDNKPQEAEEKPLVEIQLESEANEFVEKEAKESVEKEANESVEKKAHESACTFTYESPKQLKSKKPFPPFSVLHPYGYSKGNLCARVEQKLNVQQFLSKKRMKLMLVDAHGTKLEASKILKKILT